MYSGFATAFFCPALSFCLRPTAEPWQSAPALGAAEDDEERRDGGEEDDGEDQELASEDHEKGALERDRMCRHDSSPLE